MDGSAVRDSVAARAEAIQPGGVTRAPTARDRIRMSSTLSAFRRDLETTVFGAAAETFTELADAAALCARDRGDAGLFMEIAADLDLGAAGPGPERYLSVGAYPLPEGRAFAPGVWQNGASRPADIAGIREDVSHARMPGDAAHPSDGETYPGEDMRAPADSWCKAPRLSGHKMETGALARQVVDGQPAALGLLRQVSSVLARLAGRLLDIARTRILLEHWLAALRPEERFMADMPLPVNGSGAGQVEAARGGLGHWMRVEDGRIAGYRIVAPSTWKFGPRDAQGPPGPVEAALVGALAGEREHTPLAVQHIVRRFDPCMVCTVH
jgi:hydrogenase large subunit